MKDVMLELSVTGSAAENYWSVWRRTHHDVTDKNNNVSVEGHDKYYH
jgi:hypothetical protein